MAHIEGFAGWMHTDGYAGSGRWPALGRCARSPAFHQIVIVLHEKTSGHLLGHLLT